MTVEPKILGAVIPRRVFTQPGSSTSFQAQAAHFRFSPDSGHIAASHRSATKSADARRGAAHGDENRQAAGAAIAADKRGVTRSQPQIHDSPRNVRLAPAGSSGRCNTSIKSFG